MAKKKKSSSSNSNSNSQASAAPAPAPEPPAPEPEPEPPAPEPVPAAAVPVAEALSETNTEVEPAAASGTSQSDLAEQLEAARLEIATLKALLHERDQEISSLKAIGGSQVSAFNSEDVGKIQERLSSLKKEQAEAGAAREAAWRHLKSVVQEIHKLASPVGSAQAATA